MSEPDAPYRHRGTRAIQRMVEFAPSTGSLALWAHHQDLSAGERTDSVVRTDGTTLYYGSGFETLPLPQQVGSVAHAVLHVALRHPQRLRDLRALRGDVDAELFNICADAIVNSTLGHLSWLQLPPGAVFLERLLERVLEIKQSAEGALLEWDVERLYRAIDDRRRGAHGGRRANRGGEGAAGSGKQGEQAGLQQDAPAAGARQDGPRAAHVRALAAGSATDLRTAADAAGGAPELQTEQAHQWSERLLRAHAGDGVHSMLRALIADVPRTRTPWEQVLRRQLARGLAPRPALSWSRPSRSYLANQGRSGPQRRMPWEPGYCPSKAVPRLVVIVDVSGSIEEPLLQRFAREIEAITRRLEAGLVLIIGDERVQRVEHCEPGRSALAQIQFKGGGGTDFTPLIEEADRHRPDIVVVLTDLDGPARTRPSWPIIWAVTEAHRHANAPFGRKLVLS